MEDNEIQVEEISEHEENEEQTEIKEIEEIEVTTVPAEEVKVSKEEKVKSNKNLFTIMASVAGFIILATAGVMLILHQNAVTAAAAVEKTREYELQKLELANKAKENEIKEQEVKAAQEQATAAQKSATAAQQQADLAKQTQEKQDEQAAQAQAQQAAYEERQKMLWGRTYVYDNGNQKEILTFEANTNIFTYQRINGRFNYTTSFKYSIEADKAQIDIYADDNTQPFAKTLTMGDGYLANPSVKGAEFWRQ